MLACRWHIFPFKAAIVLLCTWCQRFARLHMHGSRKAWRMWWWCTAKEAWRAPGLWYPAFSFTSKYVSSCVFKERWWWFHTGCSVPWSYHIGTFPSASNLDPFIDPRIHGFIWFFFTLSYCWKYNWNEDNFYTNWLRKERCMYCLKVSNFRTHENPLMNFSKLL